MQPEERDAAHVWDMLEAARAAVRFLHEVPLPAFLEEDAEVLRSAVERKLEIVGEAARRVSPSFRDGHPEIPWREATSLRNLISHEYHKVNYREIHRIVLMRLPDLIGQLAPLVTPPPELD